jgi:hypothetical protein
MWKCTNPDLEWQIRCFPYGECSDVPRFQQVEQKAVGRAEESRTTITYADSIFLRMRERNEFDCKVCKRILVYKL